MVQKIFRHFSRAVIYLVVTDALAFFGAFGVAMRLRFRPFINVIEIRTGELIPEAAFVGLLSLVAVPAVFHVFRLYQRRVWFSRSWHAIRLVQAVAAILAGYLILQYLTKSPIIEESRLVILMWGGFTLAATAVNRLVVFPLLLHWAASGAMHRRIAIIGINEFSRKFAADIQRQKDRYLLYVVGFVSDQVPAGEDVLPGVPCLGSLHRLERLAELYNLEGVVLTAGDSSYEELMDSIERCVQVFGWVDVHTDRTAGLARSLDTDTYFDIPFLRMRSLTKRPFQLWPKRMFDLVVSASGIVVLSPLFLLIALLVKLTSPGPVLYVSERIGRGGKPFKFYKFRSMVVGADKDHRRLEDIKKIYANAEAPAPTKIVNRALLTPIGGFLRKWALDELPQLFNVLKGEMSLVGPRPLPKEEYDAQDPWQRLRYEALPGCTGLWKVYASRQTAMTCGHSVLYDIYYARNANLLLDIVILARTAWIILAGLADGVPAPPEVATPSAEKQPADTQP